ncbi:MAG: WYL domain-containing protein [Bacteroidaceae bacterium]|nr:WYL domain-containing protein [Bacteroidaceae bacterium]
MISKTYYRYIWLLNLLLDSDPLTFDEICMMWEMNPAFDGPLPIRTFHEHRKGIKEMFGVDIECDRSKGNVYYVKNPEVLEKKKLEKWLLRNYSIPQDFVTFNAMKDRILLEEIPLGRGYLDDIIDAMHRSVELRIDYQRYEQEREEHLQTFHFQPYALKVYNRRWYLLGFLKEQEALRIISLDRIIDLQVLKTTFELPSNFNARKYFADVVGIFVNEDLPVSKVKIRAYGVQAEYLRSTPLHKTQSEVRSKHGEFAEFTYRICVTPELTSQLLAMGDTIEVLEPEELREEIKEKLENCLTIYRDYDFTN